MPCERVLGRSFKIRASGVMRDVNECCYDIPLLESLQSLLNNQSVLDQVCFELEGYTEPLSAGLRSVLNSGVYAIDLYCNGSKQSVPKEVSDFRVSTLLGFPQQFLIII